MQTIKYVINLFALEFNVGSSVCALVGTMIQNPLLESFILEVWCRNEGWILHRQTKFHWQIFQKEEDLDKYQRGKKPFRGKYIVYHGITPEHVNLLRWPYIYISLRNAEFGQHLMKGWTKSFSFHWQTHRHAINANEFYQKLYEILSTF